jgi:hypothetical protein
MVLQVFSIVIEVLGQQSSGKPCDMQCRKSARCGLDFLAVSIVAEKSLSHFLVKHTFVDRHLPARKVPAGIAYTAVGPTTHHMHRSGCI